HPGWMQSRYDSWVEGLNGDWLVSRQRFFGVPFPLWYPVRPDGSIDQDAPIVPPESSLPIDPSSDVPSGFSAEQRGAPGGFVGDPDVMDTWATSSLTPQIACGWEDDPDLFARTFPMDVRPQGPEIIRTWLFSTLLRSHLEHDRLPWSDTSINGWILDPDRKKMSKSKGNVVTPAEVLQRHGSDAVRYWAASARPGTDTALDEGQMKVGRRLAVKLLNASKFALAFPEAGPGPVTEPVDRALLARLASVVEEATAAFDGYDYARALERTEAFFWPFCDDYIELVKTRAYAEGAADSRGADSARRALRLALSVLLRLFAPVLPFTTEEVWSWWQPGSVHAQSWPEAAQLHEAGGATGDPALLMVAGEVLGQIRKAKSSAKVSMRAPVERLEVRAGRERTTYVRQVETDLRGAGVVTDLVVSEVEGDEGVEVTLAPTDHFAG
ncbi:MAG: valine--tRNA ligase, partial [Actinobacteria bacterium]|nr:valine--tRNA ligase [Actinomycetota bacterium]